MTPVTAGTSGNSGTGGSDAGGPGVLAGFRVVLARTADRSAAMAKALMRQGADVLLMPLIDFEVPADSSAVDQALRGLAEGRFGWLVITSTTTIRALKQRAQAGGASLADLVPRAVRVVAVGEATGSALAAEGIRVHSIPQADQSGRGIVQAMPSAADAPQFPEGHPLADASSRVLLPQADLAADTVANGLAAKGWQVDPVVAYRTVPWPARPEYSLTAQLSAAESAEQVPPLPQLKPSEFHRLAREGGVDAVVLTSPSSAVRLLETVGSVLERVKVIAIGRVTAEKAASLGLRVSGIAAEPTPDGLVRALGAAAGHGEAQDQRRTTQNRSEVNP